MERNNDMPKSAVNEVNAESNGLQEQALDDNGLENIVSPSGEVEEKTSTPEEDREMRPVGAKPTFAPGNAGTNNIDLLLDVPLGVSVELGRTKIAVRDMLRLGPGSVLELDKMISEPLDLLVNDRLIARGEVVVFDENFGIRITDIIKPEDRIRSLR